MRTRSRGGYQGYQIVNLGILPLDTQYGARKVQAWEFVVELCPHHIPHPRRLKTLWASLITIRYRYDDDYGDVEMEMLNMKDIGHIVADRGKE